MPGPPYGNPYFNPGAPQSPQVAAGQAQLAATPTGYPGTGVGLYGSFRNPWQANPGAGSETTPYGGYAGGYGATRDQLLAQQAAAGNQKAPTANFGQAQGYLNQLGGVQAGQNANLSALNQEANQLRGIANGGQTAADTAFNAAQKSGAAAQQSMAAGAAPGAAWSAGQRDSAANQGYAAQQGVGQKAQLDFAQQNAALGELGQVQSQQAQALQAARGLGLQRVQGQQGISEFNPTMQEGQNALNAETQSGYNTGLLGMQQTAQQLGMQSSANENAYYLGTKGMNVAQQGLAIGAAGSGLGAGLGQLSSAFSSGPSAQPTTPPGGAYGGYSGASTMSNPMAVSLPGGGY